MKIVISPAKTLDYESKLPTRKHTMPAFLEQSETIQETLKEKSQPQLMELMDISDKLAELNWQRNQEWATPFTTKNARPAVYAFNGDVYTGLDAYTIPTSKLNKLQDTLRILSGLYGLLKPLDLIQPYRLEMGTKLEVGEHKDLYDFWRSTVTETLNNELKDDELFLNLASQEYFNAIDEKALKVPVVTCEFKDYKDGKLRMVSFFAKKARGMMVRYILDKNIRSLKGLKGFDYDGYRYDPKLSDKTTLVFTR
ncbi:peroxide stress protein YaaA [Flavobacterium sp. D11R37]|uniref:peroxide stress protein YaaA n=1 Tax=Flavobacterium coralii TaxID=2838017 RepID=UPI001CA77061|nr:peroxide stress protein YaaA [Flavobacterium coralii]MBY8961290.1 peroxide stress protein YaaA [Flavobacterium coralii]